MMTRFSKGQSLVEFAIGFGVLILILSAGAYFGLGMYYGQMAGDAIREVSMHKFTMADDPNAYSPGDLAAMINGSKIKGNINTGNLVDSGTLKIVKDDSQPTAIVVGQKKYVAMGIPLIFTVSQGVQKNLLEANGGSTKSRTWFPPQRTPPWEATIGGRKGMPFQVRCSPMNSSSITEVDAQAVGKDSGVYLPKETITLTSPVDKMTTLMLAKDEMGDCAGEGASCSAEREALMPRQKSKNYNTDADTNTNYASTLEYYNPPGAPGQTAKMLVMVNSNDGEPMGTIPLSITLSVSDNLLPGQGFYIDPSQQYKQPPPEFTPDCKKRKQAQCALRKAVKRAQDIKAKYLEECNMT